MNILTAEEVCEVCIMALKPILTYLENYARNPSKRLSTFPRRFQSLLVDKLRTIQLVNTTQLFRRYSLVTIANVIGLQQLHCRESGRVKAKILFHLEKLSGGELMKLPLKEMVSILSIIMNNGLDKLKTKVNSSWSSSLVDEVKILFETTVRVLEEFTFGNNGKVKPSDTKFEYLQLQVITSNCLIFRQLLTTYHGPIRPLLYVLNSMDRLRL
jgi:hypothetical protein